MDSVNCQAWDELLDHAVSGPHAEVLLAVRSALDTVEAGGGAAFRIGDPGEALVLLRKGKIEVHEFAISWQGSHTPELESLPFACFDAATSNVPAILAAVQAVRVRRQKRFYRCRLCGARVPPEWRSGSTCHACMEKSGIVF